MRATKIRRRSTVFRRRRVGRVIGKVCLWLLVIPAVVGGYFLAQHLFGDAPREPVSTSTPTTVPTTAPTVSTAPTSPPQDDLPDQTALTGLRGIYLPTAALRSLAEWDDTLTAAAAAGYNAVLFDLKDVNGRVWYTSATPLAQEARAVQEDALTAEELRQVIDTLANHGLTAVPRLYAFRDNTAPRYLETARVSVAGSPGAVWYDNDPSAGGRRWLNPYSADARRYVTALATELKEIGFSLLMLDGVQFPAQESQAYYGNAEQTAAPRNEVLTLFVNEMNDAVGEESWLLCATALAAVGEQTTVYGGNPVAYGAPAVSPWVLPSSFGSRLSLGGEKLSDPAGHPYEAVTLLLTQLKARLEFIEQAERPVIVPWLQGEGYSAAQIAEQQRAVADCFGEDAPYILYAPDGDYPFG